MLALVQLAAEREDWHGHMGWGGGWWMIVLSTAMMVIVVGSVLWLIGSGPARRGPHVDDRPVDPLDSARSVLAERYAAGDITLDEYRERMSNLSPTKP